MRPEAPRAEGQAVTDGKCDYFNRTWLQFTGRKLEEERGDGWAQGVHADDVARVVQEYSTRCCGVLCSGIGV